MCQSMRYIFWPTSEGQSNPRSQACTYHMLHFHFSGMLAEHVFTNIQLCGDKKDVWLCRILLCTGNE